MEKSTKEILLNILDKYKMMGFEYLDPIIFDSIQYNNQVSSLPNKLDILKKHIDSCNLCKLSLQKGEFRKEDIKHSDLMIISISPNITEQEKNLLANMINNVLKLDPNVISKSFLVQCPFSNNQEILDYVKSCKGYLIKEIELVKPKLIIMFTKAYNLFFDLDEDIREISGTILKYKNIVLVPLLDLDFLIKNPSYKKRVFEDLKKIKLIWDKI